MTISWNEVRLTCIHGVREGLDPHDCAQCYELAKKEGLDLSKGKTYIYLKPVRQEEKV